MAMQPAMPTTKTAMVAWFGWSGRSTSARVTRAESGRFTRRHTQASAGFASDSTSSRSAARVSAALRTACHGQARDRHRLQPPVGHLVVQRQDVAPGRLAGQSVEEAVEAVGLQQPQPHPGRAGGEAQALGAADRPLALVDQEAPPAPRPGAPGRRGGCARRRRG